MLGVLSLIRAIQKAICKVVKVHINVLINNTQLATFCLPVRQKNFLGNQNEENYKHCFIFSFESFILKLQISLSKGIISLDHLHICKPPFAFLSYLICPNGVFFIRSMCGQLICWHMHKEVQINCTSHTQQRSLVLKTDL